MRILLSMLVLLALTSCVSAPPPPPPARREAPPAPVVALPPPAPLASDWRDWPQTPGDWRYFSDPRQSTALFGDGVNALSLTCFRQNRRVTIGRPGDETGPITVRTTSLTRALPTSVLDEGGAAPAVTATLSATDPLLDAMGFSRGRFVVEQPGRPPLVLPAWAEVERVVEDCRG